MRGRPAFLRNLAFVLAALLVASWSGILAVPPAAGAGEQATFEGRVRDTKNKAVEGAMVFLYASPDIRRTANFISNRTDSEGRFSVVLPAGHYWAVARLKKVEGYGPLMPGDKHSGDPVEVEFGPGKTVRMDFTVADLQEAIRTRSKDRERAFKISGRIVDDQGAPVPGAYAIANKAARVLGIPDYLSAWADEEGRYTIYLPRGKYNLGAARSFPPGQDYVIQGQISVDADKAGVDIIGKKPAGR